MRILIISQYFYPENFRINDLVLKLKSRKHEITVLTGKPNYPTGQIFPGFSKFTSQREVWNGVEVIRIPIIPRQKSKNCQLVINYLSFLISACIFSPFLLKNRCYDIIFSTSYSPATSNIPGILLKWLKKSPMIVWIQDLWPESLSATGAVRSKSILNLVSIMMRWIYKKSDLILIQSKKFQEPILKIASVEGKIKFFPNWAEDVYKLKMPKLNLSLPRGFKVMFAGNLGKAQALEVIIGAAELLRDKPISWIILGDGRQADWLRQEIQRKKLSHCVYQLGSKPMTSMPAYFASADAMLVTLNSDPYISNTIPGKVQSYLAAGCVIIGALNGEGARVIRESRAGISVDSGDIKGLALAIMEISSFSEKKLKTLRTNAISYYNQNFNSDKLLFMLEKEMKVLIKQN